MRNHARRARRGSLAVFAIAAVAVACAAPLPAQAAWTPVQEFPIGVSTRHADVTIDEQGNATAVWESWVYADRDAPGQRVWSATRPAGGSWSAAGAVAPVAAGEAQWDPQLVVDAAGTTTAVWREGTVLNTHPAEIAGTIRSAVKPLGGGWGPPETIGAASDATSPPDVAIDAGSGDVTAVWSVWDADGDAVLAATRPAGGAWQPAEEVVSGVAWNAPEVAAGDGVVALVGSAGYALGARVFGAVEPSGGSWDVEEIGVGGDFGSAGDRRVAIDADGSAVAVWRDTGTGDVIGASRSNGGTSWVATPIGRGIYPALDVNAGGDVLATWVERDWDLEDEGRGALIQSSFRPSGRAWQAAELIRARSIERSAIEEIGDVAIDAAGGATFVWNALRSVPSAHRAPTDADWGDPDESYPYDLLDGVSMLSDGADRIDPVVVSNAAGDVVAAFAPDSAFNSSGWAAGGDFVGPRLNGLTVPATATVGVPVDLSVAPLDVWSGVAGTTWDLGDGSSAAGTSARHAWSAPGRRLVTVRSTDTLGQTTSATRTVVVSEPGSGRGEDPGRGRGEDPGRGRGEDPGRGRGEDPGRGRGGDPGPGPGPGGGPTAPPRGPVGGGAADRSAPRIVSLGLTARRVSLQLSEAARIDVSIDRCRTERRGSRRVSVCSRVVHAELSAAAGRSGVRLARALRDGRYRLRVVAVDRAGNRGRATRGVTLG